MTTNPRVVVYAHSDDRLNDLVEMQRNFWLTTPQLDELLTPDLYGATADVEDWLRFLTLMLATAIQRLSAAENTNINKETHDRQV